jgi:thiamine-monophosphate kinase
MTLRSIGEFGFIKKISRGCLIRPDHVIKSIGDDAAAFTIEPDLVSLITTDLLVERIHFIRNSISGFDLGYKSLAVNLSDIAAMGGNAREAFISIAIPPNCSLEYLEALYDGIKSLAARFDVNILGGDTTSSKEDLIINIVVQGTAERTQMLCRDAACPGDIIVSTGCLGDSKAGLHMILNSIPADTEDLQSLLRAHVLPEPHLDEGRFLASQPGTHAGIDCSDGLSSDLGHIAEESQAGATLYSDKIPVSESLLKFCSRFNYDPIEYALSGGEDYTLLCTIAPENAKETAARFQAEFNKPLFLIGEITENKVLTVTYPDGSSKPIALTGWNHFKGE